MSKEVKHLSDLSAGRCYYIFTKDGGNGAIRELCSWKTGFALYFDIPSAPINNEIFNRLRVFEMPQDVPSIDYLILNDEARARKDYENDLKREPLYHDGTKRPTWNELDSMCRGSWKVVK